MDKRQENIALHLQHCLDLVLNENRPVEEVLRLYPQEAEELGPLIEQALFLQVNSSAFDPDPQFVQLSKRRLLSRLSETHEAFQKPAASNTWWSWLFSLWGNRTLAVRFAFAIIMILCLFTGGTGVAFASQKAIPGDAFYGVKIGLEDLTLAITPDQARNALLNMQYAERRLVEIRTLQLHGQLDLVAPTLLNYEKHIEQAMQVMARVVLQDPARGAQIASIVQEKVASQLAELNNLAQSSQGQEQKDILLAQSAAQQSLEAAQRITGEPAKVPETETPLVPSSTNPIVVIVNTPLTGSTSIPTEVPTALPSETPTPVPAFLPTFTVQPTEIELPGSTATLTSTLGITPTPPVRVINPEDTERAHPTKKPHPTHPPTKTPKPSKSPQK
jgi:type II secretory pathway pseudopilin PulG